MKHVAFVVLLALAAERPVHAEEKGTVRLIVESAVDRTRRRIAIGPMIGVGSAYTIDNGEADIPFSFGIGLALFQIPIFPEPEEIKVLVMDEIKARVAIRLEDIAAQGLPVPGVAEIQSITKDITEQLIRDYIRKRRHHTLEKPQLAVALEEVRMPGGGTWITRLTAGFPIWKLTIGPSILGALGDVQGAYLGGELAVHLTPRDSPRSPVIDFYVRGDVGVAGGAKDADMLWFGMRLMLDII